MLYWLNACSTAALNASDDSPQRSVCVEQAIGKPIKVSGKVALRLAGA
jgi:hypothetical protein